ncbi:hypothetical protein NKH18_03030 [Streptomyces sp. M10(2022)]
MDIATEPCPTAHRQHGHPMAAGAGYPSSMGPTTPRRKLLTTGY